jgi:hypothetical protein
VTGYRWQSTAKSEPIRERPKNPPEPNRLGWSTQGPEEGAVTRIHEHVSEADAGFVLSTLERDQLVVAKNVSVPRRKLRGGELAVLWALRVYLLFMMAVVFWQAWTAAR